MWVSSAVCDDGHFSSDPFKTVPNHRGHRHQTIIIRAHKDFLNLAGGMTLGSIIVKNEFYVAEGNCIIERHPRVNVPGFNCSRINARKIYFAESIKVRSVITEHMHDLAPFV